MARQKHQAVRGADLSGIARSILVHTGVAVYCDDHSHLAWQDDKHAEKFAYALGANMIRRGQLKADPDALNAALALEIRSLADICPECGED